MSLLIYEGTTGLSGLFEKLNALGAFTDYFLYSDGSMHATVNNKARFCHSNIPEGTTGRRTMGVAWMNDSVNYGYAEAYNVSTSTNLYPWRIVQLDTGFVFGLATSTSGEPQLSSFIGTTLNENGEEGVGAVAFTTDSKFAVCTPNVTSADRQNENFFKTVQHTKMSQVQSLKCGDKFKDLFFINCSPINGVQRKISYNGQYYYAGSCNMALRFGGL
jgi:hypothetical protein